MLVEKQSLFNINLVISDSSQAVVILFLFLRSSNTLTFVLARYRLCYLSAVTVVNGCGLGVVSQHRSMLACSTNALQGSIT